MDQIYRALQKGSVQLIGVILETNKTTFIMWPTLKYQANRIASTVDAAEIGFENFEPCLNLIKKKSQGFN